jgi:hypothetical protein
MKLFNLILLAGIGFCFYLFFSSVGPDVARVEGPPPKPKAPFVSRLMGTSLQTSGPLGETKSVEKRPRTTNRDLNGNLIIK